VGLVVILLSSVFLQAVLGYEPPHTRPGPAADNIYFKAFHQDIASASLQQGDMDIYIYGLKTLAAEDLSGNANVQLYQAPATSISLLLNPAPAPTGQLNPFSIKEVRFAINYVIDREYITQEIYRGMAESMMAHVGPSDYDYRIVQPLVREMNLSYQPELAQLREIALTSPSSSVTKMNVET
jgi:peptide/nickel transport system substrate-binding protein